MFDEEYNDYEEYTELETNPEYMEMVKDHMARSNWQEIKTKGIDSTYFTDKEEINRLRDIINETIQYFEEIEEYEKCADLKRALDQI